MIVNKYVLIFSEPLHCTYMENASFVNMGPILVPGDKINHTDFVGDQSKLFFTSGPEAGAGPAAGARPGTGPADGARDVPDDVGWAQSICSRIPGCCPGISGMLQNQDVSNWSY